MRFRAGTAVAILVTAVLGNAGVLGGTAVAGAERVRFEQRIGEPLPLDVPFFGPDNAPHRLRDYFGDQPAVLYFGYARCPQLCSVVADGTVAALRQIKPEVGRDFAVLAISIDPAETPAEARRREADAVHRYGRPAGGAYGWNFLRGSEESIRALTEAAGFHFTFDPISRNYGHPSGFLVATPDGRISRYFLGVDFPAVEVARAIERARQGSMGVPDFELLLQCFRGDGVSGRYGILIWRVLGGAVLLTVVGLGGGIGWMLRSERRALRIGRRTES